MYLNDEILYKRRRCKALVAMNINAAVFLDVMPTIHIYTPDKGKKFFSTPQWPGQTSSVAHSASCQMDTRGSSPQR
jgi:hypothetical protein